MIERVTTLMTAQLTLSDLNRALDRVDTSQQQLSTGKRINQPSDDPYGTGLALALNGQLSSLTAYSNNVSDGSAWTQAAQSSLTNIGNAIQRVRELVVEAGNGTDTQSDLNAVAAEVDQLTAQVKQEANSQYSGQYIFSGTATSTAPYTEDSTAVVNGSAAANDSYQGGSGNVDRLIGPSGTTVTVNVDISQLLGSGQTTAGQPGGDGLLLNTLRDISDDLKSGNTARLSGSDLSALDTNLNTALTMQASLGAVTDRLQLAGSRIQDLQTSASQVLSNTQDADMAQTEIAYSTEQAALQAALQASTHIVQDSLVNFLTPTSG
jgi:flagellar hook-associated protein 3 FlgL